MPHQVVNGSILLQPLGGRLGPDFVHPRHIVNRIAHEHQVIDDAIRPDAKLIHDTCRIQLFTGHRVHQGDIGRDQLGKVFVACGDNRAHIVIGRPMRQRTDNVVGLDALDPEHGPAQRTDRLIDRLDLGGKVLGHGRTVGLVLRVHVFPERLAPDVEDTSRVVGLIIVHQFAHHVDYAI